MTVTDQRELLATGPQPLDRLSDEEFAATLFEEHVAVAPQDREMLEAAVRTLLARGLANYADDGVQLAGVAAIVRAARARVCSGVRMLALHGDTATEYHARVIETGVALWESRDPIGVRSYELDTPRRCADRLVAASFDADTPSMASGVGDPTDWDETAADSAPLVFTITGTRVVDQDRFVLFECGGYRGADGLLRVRFSSVDGDPRTVLLDATAWREFLVVWLPEA